MPSGHTRGWHRRRRRPSLASAPAFVRYAVIALAALLVITMLWRGVRWTMHPTRIPSEGMPLPYSSTSAASAGDSFSAPADLWQRDFAEALVSAAHDAGAGNISTAEMDVDRAESTVMIARLQSRTASPEFFVSSVANLDRVLQSHADDARLVEHVTLARIEVAALRSSLGPPAAAVAPVVTQGAPRELAANMLLDPALLGGKFLDATNMPDNSEVLLPPASRTFADNIRVQDLTIAGAAQTLDGIHWRNVTFSGTRLRYEGGPLDLENVHFANCRFGFPIDARGARLATAITLGQTSITIE
jgi:hypothetical protein